mgnify:CR=1 FL=1
MNFLLIGNPNVGKSSIYNKLTGINSNIIHSEAGTTRDWHKDLIKDSNNFIFDTPGNLTDNIFIKKLHNNKIYNEILSETDIFLYVIDYKTIFNNDDKYAIDKLRKYGKKTVLIINKFDNYIITPNNDYLKYGLENSFFLSCAHNYGFDLLIDFLNESKNSSIIKNTNNFDYQLAIFGKPNAGKSTFLNTSLGYERFKTSNVAGTTSDFVEELLVFKNKSLKIIDTAGIGRKSNIINKSISFFSIKKSIENINKVDAALIIIDSQKGMDRQDKRIIDLITDKAKSIIIIFNKIDLIENKDSFKKETINNIDYDFHQIKNIKVLFCSSFSKTHTNKIFNYLFDNIFEKKQKISTSKLNTWLKKTILLKQHPLIENKNVNFKYAVQIKSSPITIKIFCSYSNRLKNDYKRFLVNNFNKNFKIINQKTKFVFSSVKNPYV